MVNGKLIYGVKLSNKDFYNILNENINGRLILKKYNIHSFSDFENGFYPESDDDFSVEEIQYDDICDEFNKLLDLNICTFKEYKTCCLTDDDDYDEINNFFLGWESYGANANCYVIRINMITPNEIAIVNSTISIFISHKLDDISTYIASDGCSFCT